MLTREWRVVEVKWDCSSLSASRWRMEELPWDCQCNLAPRLAAQPQKIHQYQYRHTSTYILSNPHMFKLNFTLSFNSLSIIPSFIMHYWFSSGKNLAVMKWNIHLKLFNSLISTYENGNQVTITSARLELWIQH